MSVVVDLVVEVWFVLNQGPGLQVLDGHLLQVLRLPELARVPGGVPGIGRLVLGLVLGGNGLDRGSQATPWLLALAPGQLAVLQAPDPGAVPMDVDGNPMIPVLNRGPEPLVVEVARQVVFLGVSGRGIQDLDGVHAGQARGQGGLHPAVAIQDVPANAVPPDDDRG